MITQEIKAEVLERTDLVELVGRYVELKKAGTLFKACCPFHDEKTPSFVVTPERQTYHCFGCQVHGNAISFMMEHEQMHYPEAVKHLAAAAGITVPESRPETPAMKAAREEKKSLEERLLEVQDQVTAFYTQTLFGPRGEPGRAYLKGRGVSAEAAEAFRLGWADGNKVEFEAFIEEKEIERDDLVKLGLLVKPEAGWVLGQRLAGGYLRFRERLMFPIIDIRGEVRGYSGRILDNTRKAAKYINSPETPIFTKGDQLYGAFTARHAARRAGRLILCEGNIDVVALWQAGFKGTAAAMGTALTPKQVRLAKRLAERVVCVMDGDAAGEKAAFASLLPFLDVGVLPRAVMLPAGEDPDSFVQAKGAEAFETLIDGARPLLDLFIDRVAARCPDDPVGRAEALKALAPALSKLDDTLTAELYRARVCEALEVPGSLVETAITQSKEADRLTEEKRQGRTSRRSTPHTPSGTSPRPASPRATPPRAAASPQPKPDSSAGPWSDDLPLPEYIPGPAVEPEHIEMWAPSLFDGPQESSSGPSIAQTFSTSRDLGEVLEMLMAFPGRATNFIEMGGADCLTNSHLSDFVSRLCEQVEQTPAPNMDRLLSQVQDPRVAAYLRERQVRRPSVDDANVGPAFDNAVRNVLQGYYRQRRGDLTGQIVALNIARLTGGAAQMLDAPEKLVNLKQEIEAVEIRILALEQHHLGGAN